MNVTMQDWGPWALVTGASTGLGLEFAHHIASQGVNLLMVARDPDWIGQAARTVQARWGVEVRWLDLDLSRAGAVDQLMSWVGDLDIGLVVSNAGSGRPSAFLDLTEADLGRAFQINGKTHADLAYRFGPRLKARGKAGFLLVAAMGAEHGIPYMAADAAAKAMVISLGRALHHEWKGSGVHVTVLSPGPTQTPVIAKLGFDALALPMKPASAAHCVRTGLGALVKNRPFALSGWLFRLLGVILPPSTWTAMNGAMLKKAAAVVAARA